ncbi:MAG: glycosyltransferase family 2 protein [Flavobacteriales bacterium]
MSLEHTPTPRVSVLMTLYNKGPFVEEAVRSVLDNTFGDLELLVVDDASTDDGVERVRRITDPRIRLLTHDRNTGRAAAANRGYDAARGEYLAILDADDIAHPERLAKQVAFMDAHPDVGVCGSFAQLIGDRAVVGRWPATDHECRGKMLFGDPVLYGSAILRRAILEQHALRSDGAWLWPGEDYLFLLKVGRFARYANLQDALLYYRMGANNQRHGRDPIQDRAMVVREAFRFFDVPMTDDDLVSQLALHQLFRTPFNARQVRDLWSWTSTLRRMNAERALFPADLFEAQLQHRWQRLFHTFADHDVRAALTHLRCSRSWPLDRLVYLVKTTLKRWLRAG